MSEVRVVVNQVYYLQNSIVAAETSKNMYGIRFDQECFEGNQGRKMMIETDDWGL